MDAQIKTCTKGARDKYLIYIFVVLEWEVYGRPLVP